MWVVGLVLFELTEVCGNATTSLHPNAASAATVSSLPNIMSFQILLYSFVHFPPFGVDNNSKYIAPICCERSKRELLVGRTRFDVEEVNRFNLEKGGKQCRFPLFPSKGERKVESGSPFFLLKRVSREISGEERARERIDMWQRGLEGILGRGV